MKISIGICTHNEGEYIRDSLNIIRSFLGYPSNGHEYEVVILDDHSTDPTTTEILFWATQFPFVRYFKHALNNDFAAHKNYLIEQCTGDWIINLDADEILPRNILYNIPLIIESNPTVEAYWLPRINTVDGLTLKHVQKWGWIITTLPNRRVAEYMEPLSPEYELLKEYNLILGEEDIGHVALKLVKFDQPIICWPDPQMRVFKRSPEIRWVNKVHERLTGFKNFSSFPFEPEYAILHPKEIARQEQQNNFYETITK